MAKILITELECIVNDEIDKDEVFLKYKGKKIWPKSRWYTSMDTGEKFPVEIEITHDEPSQPLVIELWDFDYLSPNDFLGYFEINLGNERLGKFSTSMTLREKGSTASYVLFWEIA